MVQIIDNFLSPYEFKRIKNLLTGQEFPWYYNYGTAHVQDKKNYQFTHTFYDLRPPWNGTSSPYHQIFSSCFQLLQVEKLYRVKSNCNPKTFFHRNLGYHVDIPDITTSVLYVNSNNGGTKFKNGTFVRSVENRMVIFDSNQEHAGVTCTDKNVRVVVNFNYEKYGKN